MSYLNYNRDYGAGTTAHITLSFPLGTIGLITFIVFLILKLCNQSNPDFEWLTWFWVWFPLWVPIAATFALWLIILLIALIVRAFDR